MYEIEATLWLHVCEVSFNYTCSMYLNLINKFVEHRTKFTKVHEKEQTSELGANTFRCKKYAFE